MCKHQLRPLWSNMINDVDSGHSNVTKIHQMHPLPD